MAKIVTKIDKAAREGYMSISMDPPGDCFSQVQKELKRLGYVVKIDSDWRDGSSWMIIGWGDAK